MVPIDREIGSVWEDIKDRCLNWKCFESYRVCVDSRACQIRTGYQGLLWAVLYPVAICEYDVIELRER